jgi:hypothetical protein
LAEEAFDAGNVQRRVQSAASGSALVSVKLAG